MKAFLIGLIILVAVSGGAYALLHTTSNRTAFPPAVTQTKTTPTSASQNVSATITFDGSKFSPATFSVKSGDTVKIKNISSQELQMDSDPHPVHTDDTDLNVGLVPAGQSRTFTVTKTGTYGFHDHLDPSIKGKITVQ